MKHVTTITRQLLLVAAGGLALAHGAAQAQVSVSVGVPGVYGRVVVGERPPEVIYSQPVVIQPSPVAVVQQPIYMHVPPVQYQRWSYYCGRYGACGQPVYFVRDMPPRPVMIREPMRRPPGWDRHGPPHGHHHHHDHDGPPGPGGPGPGPGGPGRPWR